MKNVLCLLTLAALVACGNGDDDEKPTRIVRSGALFTGDAGGTETLAFDDGSKLNFIASGVMTLETPKGIFRGTAFPADVSYSVRAAGGRTLTGSVSFARIIIGNNDRFEGVVNTDTVKASVVGYVVAGTSPTVIDVEGFAYALPVTDEDAKSRTLILQAPQLVERKLEPQP